MSHDGLTSTRLPLMRRALDEMVLSERERRAVDKAVSRVDADWYTKHRDAYTSALTTRDQEHDVIVAAAEEFRPASADGWPGRVGLEVQGAWYAE